MAQKSLEETSITSILKMVSHLVKLPTKHLWLDYDTEADIIYLHFEKEPHSNYSEMRDDGIILDYHNTELVGMTILEASQR